MNSKTVIVIYGFAVGVGLFALGAAVIRNPGFYNRAMKYGRPAGVRFVRLGGWVMVAAGLSGVVAAGLVLIGVISVP